MSFNAQKETLGFEAEVNQLLDLVIHSLYSNSEIFLRELISNASDACDRLRFEALSDGLLYEKDTDLKITVDFNDKTKTITISDNGIGMSREEVIENLGTIAKSGTKEFLSALTGDQSKDSKLIGQFGVGFYSAFIIADKVIVETRRAGFTSEHGVRWESGGTGRYSIENIEKSSRGTQITLFVKKDSEEFLNDWRLKNIITKYSDHIAFPVLMKKQDHLEKTEAENPENEIVIPEWETINRAQALWTRPKTDITTEEYEALYKHISRDFEKPLLWSHNRVEGNLEYTSLLYIPSHTPFDMFNQEHQHGLKLYVKRVFIMDEVKQFLPMYLRFIKGIVDCDSLPLNISREILQKSATVEKIKSALTKRILSVLDKLSKDEPEKYATFWKIFGKVIKEGPSEDFANKEDIAKLLRFSSTHDDLDTQKVSFDDYISRMKEGQDKIYYVSSDSFLAGKNSPHLEIFRQKGIEVLIMTDRIDEWLVMHLSDYQSKSLVSVSKGEVDVENISKDQVKAEEQKEAEEDFIALLEKSKETLGDKVKDVRLSTRLTVSPACIVADSYDINRNMQRILQSIGQEVPEVKPIFELNPKHVIVKHLKNEVDNARFAEWLSILFDQAILAEGGQLKDPGTFVTKINNLLIELVK